MKRRLLGVLFLGETVLNVGNLFESFGLFLMMHLCKQMHTFLLISCHEGLRIKLSSNYYLLSLTAILDSVPLGVKVMP